MEMPVDAVSSNYTFADKARWLVQRVCQHRARILVPNYVISGFAAGNNLRRLGVQTIAVIHGDDIFYQALRAGCLDEQPQYLISAVVCVSKLLAREWTAQAAGRLPVRCIPCGVPMSSTRSKRNGAVFRIVYVGRLVQEQKRIMDVGRALRKAAETMSEVEGDIIGDGPERAAVEQIFGESPARARLQCLGLLPVETVRQRMANYHAFVLLSDNEGFPVTLLEAMTCGVVPICSDIRSGIRDVVEDSATGIIVQDREADVIRAVKLLKEDVPLWQRLSSAACQAVLPYSNSKCADEWEKLIKQLAAQPAESSIKSWSPPAQIELPPWNPVFHWDDDRKPFRLRMRERMTAYKERLLGKR